MFGLHDFVAGLLGHGVDGHFDAQHIAELILHKHGHIVEVGAFSGQQDEIFGSGAHFGHAFSPQLTSQIGIIVGEITGQIAERGGAIAGNAAGYNAARADSTGHQHVVDQGLTVDGHAQSLTHLGIQTIVGPVKLHVVVAEVGPGVELIAGVVDHHVNGGQVHTVDGAGFVGVQSGRSIGNDLVVNAVQGHVLGIPVGGVLDQGHAHAHVNGGRHERAAVHQVIGVHSVLVAAGGVEGLIEGEQAGQGAQTGEVGAGSGQNYLEGAVVQSLHRHFRSGHFAIHEGDAVLDDGSDNVGIAVGLAVGDLGDEGELEVLGGQGSAVGPNQTLAQSEGVGQAVVRHGPALSQSRLGIVVGVQAGQTLGPGAANLEEVAVGSGDLVEGAEHTVAVHMQHVIISGKSGDGNGAQHGSNQQQGEKSLFHCVFLLYLAVV